MALSYTGNGNRDDYPLARDVRKAEHSKGRWEELSEVSHWFAGIVANPILEALL